MWVLVKLMPSKHHADKDFLPDVSLVVPCYNELPLLKEKVNNCRNLIYPRTKFSVIFITDGSTDGSQDFLSDYPHLTVLHEPTRNGKSAAENRAMQHVTSSVVVFCDANTFLNPNAILEIVKHYADEKVGAVAGEKRILISEKDNASASGENLYWKYESWLKKLDSDFYSAIGGAGELVSFRTSLYTPLEHDTVLDDFVQSMRIATKGYKIIYEPNAYAQEHASQDVKEEMKRKIRISAGSWQAMSRLLPAFNIFQNFRLAFTFISHKVFRWVLSPLALILLIPSGFCMFLYSHNEFYAYLWDAQLIFYLWVFIGSLLQNVKIGIKGLFIPYYFFITNWSMVLGCIRYFKGNQSVNWEKVKRASASNTHV
jgi:cellulose synthase/poly-beta-1,6-N-acetylglucosamine synthase-like glycosyltransferase